MYDLYLHTIWECTEVIQYENQNELHTVTDNINKHTSHQHKNQSENLLSI